MDLEKVYRDTRGFVFGLCLKSTRNEAEAADLTQDVFLELVKKPVKFESEKHLLNWLSLTARRKCWRFAVMQKRLVYVETLPDVFRPAWGAAKEKRKGKPAPDSREQAVNFIAHICRSLIKQFTGNGGDPI